MLVSRQKGAPIVMTELRGGKGAWDGTWEYVKSEM
jgi:hypothetical protein